MSQTGRQIRRAGQFLRTIRVRLTLWYVALLALILIALSIFLYLSLSRNLHAELDRSIETETLHLIATLDILNGQPTLSEEASTTGTGFAVILFDPTGKNYIGANTRAPVLFSATSALLGAQGQSTWDTIQLADGVWRVKTVPVVEGGRVVGVLQVASSQRDIGVALGQLVAVLAIGVPLTLLLAISVGLFLAGRALGPIDRMTRAAEQLGVESLSQRLGVQATDDEVGRLAATFDGMLDRIERAFERQRQFTADASHELRTPLTLLMSQADVALSRSRTPAEYRRVLSSMREDVRHVTQLVGDLLTLARADSGQESLAREPLDLGSLVSEAVAALQPLARTAGIRLESGAGDHVFVDGDQTRLTQLLVNLADNAMKFTPAGGTVRMSANATGGRAILEVADTGIGIASEHLPHIFERFYRVDSARSHSEGGVGLGLSISRWIAQAHGGDISVVSEAGKGTTFSVSIPLAGWACPPIDLAEALPASNRAPATSGR